MINKEIASNRKKRLGDILFDKGLITREDLSNALEERMSINKRLGEILITRKLLSDEELAKALSFQLGYRYVYLNSISIKPETLNKIPKHLAKRYIAFPIEYKNRNLTVAISDPLSFESISDISFYSGCKIIPVIATKSDIYDAIERYYNEKTSIESIINKTIENNDNRLTEIISEINNSANERLSLEERSRQAPVIRLSNLIITNAININASDIHLEPCKNGLRIRYRIDGLLKEYIQLPKQIQAGFISRIKIIAKLDIAERRFPQDGGVRIKIDDRDIDLRVSTIPSHYGEKVTIRILDQSNELLSINRLGLSEKDRMLFDSFIKRRKGIILVTGPTGSGKTTTLYSIINRIKSENTHIITVEDPIEYEIEGINQVQVNPEIGLTFSTCLRSILRHDPDIILVGEIRDRETADIAFRAAMTGHLVLSTLHTNDAASTITRLLDIGLPGYLISSLLIGVITQRLVRCICPKCKSITDLPPIDITRMDIPPNIVNDIIFYSAVGCNYCNFTGYKGRVGMFEILEVTPKIIEILNSGASEQLLLSAALSNGMSTLLEDGINKVGEGITTVEEILRVIEIEKKGEYLCNQCGRHIETDFVVCPYCGSAAPHHCKGCGRSIKEEWWLCPYCCRTIEQIHTTEEKTIRGNLKQKENKR
ncbi:MAG: ATPase, T2SS/T4P/T4SS family [Nitrospirota bacterium]